MRERERKKGEERERRGREFFFDIRLDGDDLGEEGTF